MATDNPTWSYTRMQGALKNLGYRVGRSTVARILKEQGIPPSGQRPMSWATFVGAHWPALVEFVTTELSAIPRNRDLLLAGHYRAASRRIYKLGSTNGAYELPC
jgi:hypothetical protein